ncbi:putative Polycomb group protein ASXL3 [Amia ocellicauda]|uniref:putative Polycomb group protein ASXL3 n=1 Tax=Amia ocellicauda TaxID=2972642 RepID=UPI0034647A45
MKDKRKKKDRTWAEAARLALEKHPNTPMTAKQILEVIQKEGLKETSGTSPLACLNAMLHTNTRVGDGTFLKIPGKSGLYALKKEESPSLADGATESVCESDIEGIEMTETNNSTSEENGVCAMKSPDEVSSEHDSNTTTTAVQNKSVSSTQQHTKKALKQALRQQHKRRNGVSMMVNKAVPRVVLTPLKVSDEQPDSPSESKNGFGDGDSSEKELKHGQRSPTGKQISQHLKKLKKSGLGHIKWTKAEDIDIETPGSILVNTNLRALINKHTFASLPQHFQQYLLLLLPEVDRQMGSDGVLRLSNSALNNEFFAYAAQGWKQRLAEGEFTPEMQLRIRQEMEKEKKIELWKEKFYESYYGEKLGMTEEESMVLTTVQKSTKDSSSSAVEASASPGTSAQCPAKNKEPEVTEKLFVCEEDVDQTVCNMELASKASGQPPEDILLSSFPDISTEESVVQEEIAEEVDPTACEYLEEQVKPGTETSEYISSCTPKNEEEETATLHSENANVLTEYPPSGTSVQPAQEINHKPASNEAETLNATPQLAQNSLDQTLSPPVDLGNDSNETMPPAKEELSSEEQHLQTEQTALMVTVEQSLLSKSDSEVDLSSPEEHSLKDQCNLEQLASADDTESQLQVSTQPEENDQKTQKEILTCSPSDTIAVPKEEPIGNRELSGSTLENEKEKEPSPVKQVSSSMQMADLCENSRTDSLELMSVPSPRSTDVNEYRTQEYETASVSPEPPKEVEECETDSIKSELDTNSLVPAETCASPAAEKPIVQRAPNKRLENTEIKPKHSPEKLDSKAAPLLEGIFEPVLEPEEQKPAQLLPETISAAPEVEDSTLPEVSPSENTQPKPITKEPKEESDIFPVEKTLTETHNNAKSSKQPKYHQIAEKSSALEITSWAEMLKAKHHKPHQTNHHHRGDEPHSLKQMEPSKSPELFRTDNRDIENPKRKTGEQYTGICKEKRARMEENESLSSGHSSAQSRERESLPKEELRVPPLKIQLSKVGLPFIIKTQPVSKPEPKVSSTASQSAGRNTGARTLADIKARAQQARAQREAAAAAAVAAAARITSVEGGTPSEGSKTRTLAHIKEQTKAKLFAKHQARAHSHQVVKGPKLHSTKEDRCSTDSQTAVHSKSDCPTGVIMANPNRKSPEKAFALAQGSCPTLKTFENRIAVAKSVVSISVPNSVPRSIPIPHPSSTMSQPRITNTSSGDGKTNTNPVCNPPVSAYGFTSPPQSPSVLVSVSSPNIQKSFFKVSTSKPCAKTTVSSSSHRAVLPKYSDGLSAPNPAEATCSLTNTATCRSASYVGLRYTGHITSTASSFSSEKLNSSVHSIQDSADISQRTYPPRSSTPFSFDRKCMSLASDHHAYSSSERRETQHYRDKVATGSIKGQPHVDRAPDNIICAPNSKNTVNENETMRCRPLLPADSASNKAIPCKVIVDHCSASYSSMPSSAMPEVRRSLPNKGVKTETVLRLQESIMSRAEPFRQKQDQNAIFSTASRLNNKKLQMAYNVLHGLPVSQQDGRRDGDLTEQSAANLIYSSLLYKHAEKAVINEQGNEPKTWKKEKDKHSMDTLVIHKHHHVRQSKVETTSGPDRMITSPDSSHFSETRVIKSEPSDMDTGDFKEPMNPHAAAHVLLKTSTAAVSSLAEGSVSLNMENQRRVPLAGSSSCRLSSVEANNPLVTQLLQGNLPLEKVLPQPRSGTRLEINRLPLPFQNTSVCKAAVAERNVMENPQSCLSPDGKGHVSGLAEPGHIRKQDIHANRRVARPLGELAHIKSEQGKTESKIASCHLSAHINQVGPGQPFVQEWMNKNLVHGRITPSAEIKQPKRTLPACSFQKGLLGIDKNGSYSSEASASQRLFYPPPADVRDSSPPTALLQASIKATSGCSTPNTLAFNRNQEQKGLGEVNISVATDQLRKGSVFPPNLQIKQADDIGSVSQAAQNKSLVHPPNGEVPSDQKQTVVAMETNKGLNWLPSANICSNIKVEPISFDEGLGNNCEMSIKQTSYEQNEGKDHVQVFQMKSPEFPPYMAPEPQKGFAQLNPPKNPHVPQPQQVYGNYSTIHFNNTKFNRTASVIEKSIGNFLGNSTSGASGLSNQSAPVSGQKFADGSNADELELKCSCRLKAMIVCKGCGAFCHDDCIGPSKLCVACLVVR